MHEILAAVFFVAIATFVIAIARALVKSKETKVSDEKVAAATLIALSTVPSNLGGIALTGMALGARGKHKKPPEEPPCDECKCKE